MALYFLTYQARLCAALWRRDETVILFFGTTTYLLPIVFARIIGKRVIIQPRGDVPLSLQLSWERQVPPTIAAALAGTVRCLEHLSYRTAHALITYTPSMADQLGLSRFEKKLYTNGIRYVNIDQFFPRIPFEDRPWTIGYLGRLDDEKNVPLLIEVADRLPDNIMFRFVGDGDYRSTIEASLHERIESGQVKLTGWVDHDQVPMELTRMRLLLLTSEPTEGLPTAILESFACATPVYATSVSGIPDVVKENETGFLMTSEDPTVIATTISSAMESETLTEMSHRCRAKAESDFSYDAAVERYHAIFESIHE